jgi:phosphopantothenoylcysteine decarboxylase/phosphopantothenate--cysteine ligase
VASRQGGGGHRQAPLGALGGRHILITAGPTRAPIDRVRYIANRSSGATAMAVARALLRRGAAVHLVYGPGEARPPAGVDVVRVETPAEMRDAALGVLRRHRIAAAVLAAAVLDYVPAAVHDGKLPSGGALRVDLVPAPRVMAALIEAAPDLPVVGFKLEFGRTDEHLVHVARTYIERYGLSAVLANDSKRMTAGRHPALLVAADGQVERVEGEPAIGRAIAGHLARLLDRGAQRSNRKSQISNLRFQISSLKS